MVQQMEQSLKLGRKLIDTELDTGILNFIVRPIVKAFYDYWAQHDARKGTLKQIDITLDAGRKLLLNGNSEEGFNDIVEEYFPHINYLREVKTFLGVEEHVTDYSDLARDAFKSKELATKNLMKQLEFTERGISIIEEDPSILSLPAGKKIIVKSLRKGFEESKKDFLKAIDETYD
jgi:hypothetical protein